MMLRLAPISSLVVLLSSAYAAPASAQTHNSPAQAALPDATPGELEAARDLFYEAVELLDQQLWDDAERRLRRVLEIRYSPVVAYNLANSLVPQGQYVEARQLLRGVLAHPDADHEVTGVAKALLEVCEKELGWIVIELTGDTSDIELIVNGREVPLSDLSQPVPVDPGEARVVAMRSGEQVGSAATVVGAEGMLSGTVTLDVSPSQPAPPTRSPVNLAVKADPFGPSAPGPAMVGSSDAQQAEQDGSLLEKWWFWGAVGAVAVAAVTTVVLASGQDAAPDTGIARGNFDPPLLEGTVR